MNILDFNKTILIISGLPCIGKTTIAYELIKKYPQFRSVTEMDIMRTVLRKAIENLETNNIFNNVNIKEYYENLFNSLRESSYDIACEQSKQLLPFVKDIIFRQQRRNIPTIIEGAEIIPITFFDDNQKVCWINDNIIFIYLYIADEAEHKRRRINRCKTRGYNINEANEIKIVYKIRNEKHIRFLRDAQNLSKTNNNIFTIDISNKSIEEVCGLIIKRIERYYNNINLNTAHDL